MKVFSIPAALVLGLASSAALAAPADSAIYAFGNYTYSKMKSFGSPDGTAFGGKATDVVSTNSSNTRNRWGLGLGYKYNSYLAFELGYKDLGKQNASATTQAEEGSFLSAHAKANAFVLRAIGSYPITDEFSVEGSLGLAYVHSKLDFADKDIGKTNVDYSSGSKNRFAPAIGIGATYALTDNFAIFGRYEYIGNAKTSIEEYKIKANTFDLGVRYYF